MNAPEWHENEMKLYSRAFGRAVAASCTFSGFFSRFRSLRTLCGAGFGANESSAIRLKRVVVPAIPFDQQAGLLELLRERYPNSRVDTEGEPCGASECVRDFIVARGDRSV